MAASCDYLGSTATIRDRPRYRVTGPSCDRRDNGAPGRFAAPSAGTRCASGRWTSRLVDRLLLRRCIDDGSQA